MAPSSENNTVDATTGAVTITLASTTTAGYRFFIKKIDSVAANTVTIVTQSAGTIDGATSVVLSAQRGSVTLISTATADVWIKGN